MTTGATVRREDLLGKIDALELSKQAKRLRDRYFEEPVRVGVERPRIAMRAWQESEGQPIESRRAYLLKRVFEEAPVVIHDGELTAGSETRWFRGVYPWVDHNPDLVLEQLDRGVLNLQSNVHYGQLAEKDLATLLESARYFKGKTGPDLLRELRSQALGSWWEDFIEARGSTPFEGGNIAGGVPLFERVLTQGLRGTIQEAEERIAGFASLAEDDPEKLLFWRAAITSCQALITLAHRYADLAERTVAREHDPERKRQLQRIAEACRWVPENPARSFLEAVQSVRLVHLACKLEGSFSTSMGRVDQYLYPYLRADLIQGRLTLPEATDLLADLFSYLGRQDHVFSIKNSENAQSSSAIINITIGGVSRDGQDACNELTYLLLHTAGLLKYAQPQLTFRLGPQTPRWALLKALQTNYRVGGGIPQFHNDEHVIRYIMERGASLEEARDWCVFGCSHPMSPRNRSELKPAAWFSTPLSVDLALHNGVASMTGKRIGLETGNPEGFKTFDELYTAVKQQQEFTLRRCAWQCRFAKGAWGQRYRLPFLSVVMPGCVEKGKDVVVGGQSDHSLYYFIDRGFVNTADSLIALKKLVFEEKQVSMREMLAALDSNFEGQRGEEIRSLCLAAPKYGNEDPEADAMVRDLAKVSASILFSESNPFGQPYASLRNGVGWHYYAGKRLGALPDGRKAGEPLADGSLSPMRGLDGHGPTGVMQSALAADFKEASIAILNLRFPRTMAGSPESLEKLAALTESYQRH
ncbi:MAG: hypothetical protein HYX97_07365, partial [Chloroflexi bacterium]|nr:hypothetical protein [Chloroflexota bacterium]